MPKIVVKTNEDKVIKVFNDLYPTDAHLMELRDAIEMALYQAVGEEKEITIYFIVYP